MPMDLLATSAFGLEAVVVRELQDLGYPAKTVQPGRILFSGEWEAVCQANMWLRSADRVLIRVGTFTATDFGELFDQTTDLPWEQWLDGDVSFPVVGKSVRSQLHHVPTCQKMVKKAIVERLRRAHSVVELPETGPKHSIEVSILKDEVTLSIDTTGEGLSKRGYRKLVGSAPLRETLAAAIVQLSFWKPERYFLDPFCGSGTFPIEAAMSARRMAPGLHREFASEHWRLIPVAVWNQTRQQALDLQETGAPLEIVGSDVDPKAIELARFHAKRAGVSQDVRFRVRDFFNVRDFQRYGCLFANPPYGHRLGDEEQVQQIYQRLAETFAQWEDWSYWVLAPDQDTERLFPRKADRRRKLYNGRLQCTLLQYFGPRPPRDYSANGDRLGDQHA